MRDHLDHLPASRQRELEDVVSILFEEFGAAIGLATQTWKKSGRILKLILYGSFARGDWVDDRASGYASDYDILVVVNDERLTDVVDYWSVAEDRLMRETTIAKTLSAPVNFVVHSLADLNDQLAKGRPFFVDIAKQGIALYEAEGFQLVTPGNLSSEEALAEARKHFDFWFPLSVHALRLAHHSIDDHVPRDAAFMMHQASERAYHCTLLTIGLYSPKSHKLNFLRSHAEDLAPSLIEAWPRDDKASRRSFELLRQAYVNARYSPQYEITPEQLTWLGERVAILQSLVEAVCLERLNAPLSDPSVIN